MSFVKPFAVSTNDPDSVAQFVVTGVVVGGGAGAVAGGAGAVTACGPVIV